MYIMHVSQGQGTIQWMMPALVVLAGGGVHMLWRREDAIVEWCLPLIVFIVGSI